jgi:hypothetical protein
MSTQQKQAGALPAPGQAYDHLYDRVHAQVFFGKLANAYGITPRATKQAEDMQYMLATAGRLRQVKQAEKEAADAQESPFAGPLAALDQILGIQGGGNFAKQAQAQESQMAIKAAAASLANDPTIYNCVLSLKAYEAEQAAAQLQNR